MKQAASYAFKQSTAKGNKPIDLWLLLPLLCIMVLGLSIVASASMEIAAAKHGSPWYLFNRQLAYWLVALILSSMALFIPLKTWAALRLPLMLLGIFLLLLVFVPGIGIEVNGSKRWINLSIFRFQPSEFVKVFAIVYTAGFCAHHISDLQASLSAFVRPLLILGAALLLMIAEPDFGTAVVMALTTFSILFVAGVRLKYFFSLFTVFAIAMAGIAVMAPYRVARLTSFINPWAEQYENGYQLTQALIAFGRGEWLGVGLGQGIQKLFYLPEAHTDFVLAVIAEELGLVGVSTLILCMAVFIIRGFVIAEAAARGDKLFPALVAYGITWMFALEFLINIGVNTGLLPTKGLTLPLVSYGGNSLIAHAIMIAILFRVEYENSKSGQSQNKKALYL